MASKKALVRATSRLQTSRSRTRRNLPQSNTERSKAPESKDGAAAESSSAASHPAAPLTYQRHRQSIEKAATAFKSFNLHKFSLDAVPENYIHPDKVKDPAAVLDVHKALITRQLEELPDFNAHNSGIGITAAIAKWEELQAALPGLDEHGGKVSLEHLLTYLRAHMNSSTLQTRGNPAVTRLTTEMAARRQARAIIERIKKRGGAPECNTESGAESDWELDGRTRTTPDLPFRRKREGQSDGQ